MRFRTLSPGLIRVVQEWFTAKFGTPTEPQIAGWPAILRGEPTLISAPTGSGKTLAAFLVCIDKLLRAALAGDLAPHTQVVYISPLKALSNDVQKNLDGPLAEIQQLAMQRGYLCPEIRTGVRTGDTLTKERVAMLKHPPHILVTTPESLYILLTAGKSRQNSRAFAPSSWMRFTPSPTTSAARTSPCRWNGWTLWSAAQTASLPAQCSPEWSSRRSASASLRPRTRLSWSRTS